MPYTPMKAAYPANGPSTCAYPLTNQGKPMIPAPRSHSASVQTLANSRLLCHPVRAGVSCGRVKRQIQGEQAQRGERERHRHTAVGVHADVNPEHAADEMSKAKCAGCQRRGAYAARARNERKERGQNRHLEPSAVWIWRETQSM